MAKKPGDEVRPGQVMTVDQVAAYLQLNRLTVYRYVREGKLPAAKIGKVYRIRRDDVDHFLEGQMVAPRPAPPPPPASPPVGRIRSVWVRDVKAPEEIFVGPNRVERRTVPEALILNADPLEVIFRGFN